MSRVSAVLVALVAMLGPIGALAAGEATAGELPSITARATTARTREGDTRPAVIEIARSGSVSDDLDVSYTLIYSTAGREVDYEHPGENTPNGWRAVTATATIPRGEHAVALPFVSKQDEITEGPEDVVLSLSDKPRSYAIGEPREATATIVDDEPPRAPAMPEDLVATRVGEQRVALSWTDVTNKRGYRIEQRPEGAPRFQELVTVSAQTTNYLATAVPAGRAVAYRVVAFNDTGESGPSAASIAAAAPPTEPGWLTNVTVAAEPGRFKAFPANGNAWSWGDEIVVMYEDATFRPSSGSRHGYAFERPVNIEQARSHDGGKTWAIEKRPIVKPNAPGFPWDGRYGPRVRRLEAAVDFEHPNFALHVRMSNKDFGPSYWYYSYDRAKTWKGPFLLPDFDLGTVNARTDYVVQGKRQIQLLLTGTEDTNYEDNSFLFGARSTDGGRTWGYVSKIATGLQPSTVALRSGAWVSSNRTRTGLDIYRSSNQGESWNRISNVSVDPTDRTNSPGSLTQLPDGRVVITYGYRARPFGVRARISNDGGASWSDEVVLRSDGGSADVGYTEDVLRPDGKIVTTYYFTSDPLAERTIEATIWDPVQAFGAAS